MLSDGLSLLTHMDYPKYGILTLILIYWIISAKISKKKANFFFLKNPAGQVSCVGGLFIQSTLTSLQYRRMCYNS